MARRFYLSRILFDAADLGGIGAWRHKLQTYSGVAYRGGEIFSDPATGLPARKSLLVAADDEREAEWAADLDLVRFPAVSLDTRLTRLPQDEQQMLRAGIAAHGFSDREMRRLFDEARTLRDLLNNLGRLNNPEFDADQESAAP